MFCIANLSLAILMLFQETSRGSSLWVWPAIVVLSIFIVVYSKWGRDVNRIKTNWFEIERRVASTESKTIEQDQRLADQQQQLQRQQQLMENLARYSISDYIYYQLRDVHRAQQTGGEFKYARDGSMWRNLRFMMDHGYIQEIAPEPEHGANLRDIVRITPAGLDLIALRDASDQRRKTA